MHHHAHWYTIQGISNKSAKLSWKFGRKPMMAEGDYQIWYNEDLTNGTVADNAGVACYDVEIVGVVPSTSLKFHEIEGEKPKCFMKIQGRCQGYPHMSYQDWFNDAHYGGPVASTKAICAYRRWSWQRSCGSGAKIFMSFTKPKSPLP